MFKFFLVFFQRRKIKKIEKKDKIQIKEKRKKLDEEWLKIKQEKENLENLRKEIAELKKKI